MESMSLPIDNTKEKKEKEKKKEKNSNSITTVETQLDPPSTNDVAITVEKEFLFDIPKKAHDILFSDTYYTPSPSRNDSLFSEILNYKRHISCLAGIMKLNNGLMVDSTICEGAYIKTSFMNKCCYNNSKTMEFKTYINTSTNLVWICCKLTRKYHDRDSVQEKQQEEQQQEEQQLKKEKKEKKKTKMNSSVAKKIKKEIK